MGQITLYYRLGSSDKIYQAGIHPKDGKFVVRFAYGRRGATLQAGTKTPIAVKYGAAKAIYDKLIKEKMGKGYTVGEDGKPYQHSEKEKQSSGIHCQLLHPIDEGNLSRCLEDPGYWMQEKFDGRRLLIQKEGEAVTGINRLGLVVAIPQSLEQSAKAIAGSFLIDGEAVGETLHAFDLLEINGDNLRQRNYAERFLTLMNLGQRAAGFHQTGVSGLHAGSEESTLRAT